MNGPDAPNLSPTVPVLSLNPNPEISTDSSVHLFTLGNHTVAHGVSDVGPATIVLEETVSAAVPADLWGAESSELRIGGCRTVRLGDEYHSVETAIPAAG